jgi:MYXO-CTERM domain-containing protein
MTASGGTPPYTWTANNLPPGVSLSTAGAFSGNPTTAGTYNNVQITVSDSATTPGTDNDTFTITIVAAGSPLTITNAPPANGTVGVNYTGQMNASGGTGGPYTWTANNLPPGITLSTAGAFSGSPTQDGTFNNVQITVSDGTNNDSDTFTITIAPGTGGGSLIIITGSMPNGTVGQTYSATIQSTGGVGVHSWSIVQGTLPTGLSLGTSTTDTVAITGTPQVEAPSVTIRVQVQAGGETDTEDFTFSITGGGTGPGPGPSPVGGGGGGGGGGCAADTGSSSTLFYVFLALLAGAAFLHRRHARA